MELQVSSFSDVELFDNEPYGREVRLFTWEEVLQLHDDGRLAAGTAAVMRSLRSRTV